MERTANLVLVVVGALVGSVFLVLTGYASSGGADSAVWTAVYGALTLVVLLLAVRSGYRFVCPPDVGPHEVRARTLGILFGVTSTAVIIAAVLVVLTE